MLLSKDFQIDWLEFKIEGVSNITPLTKHLFRLNFDVFLKREPDFIPKSIYTRPETKNNDRVNLTVYNYQSSKMLKVEFPGKSAKQAYSLIKQKQFHQTLFDMSKTKLSRLDIKHIRTIQSSDSISVQSFLEICKNNLIENYKRLIVKLVRERKTWYLKIGSRKRSPTHFGLNFSLSS